MKSIVSIPGGWTDERRLSQVSDESSAGAEADWRIPLAFSPLGMTAKRSPLCSGSRGGCTKGSCIGARANVLAALQLNLTPKDFSLAVLSFSLHPFFLIQGWTTASSLSPPSISFTLPPLSFASLCLSAGKRAGTREVCACRTRRHNKQSSMKVNEISRFFF